MKFKTRIVAAAALAASLTGFSHAATELPTRCAAVCSTDAQGSGVAGPGALWCVLHFFE